MRTAILCIICVLCGVNSQNLRRSKRVVGGIAAAIPPEDDPVVLITRDNRYAEVYGIRDPDDKFYVFRGIRFGEPPLGDKRFQRPKEMPLEGEIRALRWGPPCPQITAEGVIVGHEDCLFLNVFTPALPDTEDTKFPVLIWIHGGEFKRGSACQYDTRNLIKKDMVVVSIQYRLGTLGFLSTGNNQMPGNNGIFDISLAAKWVQKYIEFFAGDSKKIVAFGQGTGASSAIMLALSKLNIDMFSGLVAMSGSAISHFTFDKNPLETAKRVASANKCPTENVLEMIRCLRELPVEQLLNVDFEIETKAKEQGFVSSMSNLPGPGPVVEGTDDNRFLPNFVPDAPENTLSRGKFPSIPLLTGVVKDEAAGATLGQYSKEIATKLHQDPEFLTKYLVPQLQKVVPIFGNGTKYFVPAAFTKYLNVYNRGQPTLEKVAEALGDAIFNIPAFLTAQYWSKKAKVLFYKFEHKGKRKEGRKFLARSPFVDTQEVNEVSHGDDLGYIFKQNSILGEKINDENYVYDEEDEEVADKYTDMIAQFARSGDYTISNERGETVNASFSAEKGSFISISKTPTIKDNFRFCEMGLWTGLTERLQSQSCNLIRTTLDTVNTISEGSLKVVGDVDSKIEGTVDKVVPGVINPLSDPKKKEHDQIPPILSPTEKKINPFGGFI